MNAVRHPALVTKPPVIYERDPADPVTIAWIAKTLQVILLAGEIPHKIPEEHPVVLVVDEVFDIIGHGGLVAFHVRELLIGIYFLAFVAAIPHSWEDMCGRRVAPVLSDCLSRHLILVFTHGIEFALVYRRG